MKTKLLAVILAVVAAISAVIYFMTRQPEIKEVVPEETKVFTLASSAYSSKISVAGANGEIYLPTDRPGLYYTATLDNKIAYYVYDGNAFQPAPYEVKKTDVRLTASGVGIPVKISYINADGLTVGYGVFTSDMDKGVKIYPYAFVKIAKKPAGYGDGYFLLADFDKNNFYRADKTFSEIYSYEIGKSSVVTGLSQNTRMIDINGTFRQDWSMMTDEFIKNTASEKYFMSSRYYNADETGVRTDIMVYSNAYRPKVVVSDILGTWFVSDVSGMHYLKRDGDGFKSVIRNGDKTSDIVKFDSPYEDYLRCGNYAVNKKTGEMTNLLTGEKKKLSVNNIENATVFSLNADATKAVFATPADENTKTQQIIYYSVDTGSAAAFTEPLLWQESSGFVWIDSNKVMSVRATSEDGNATGSVIYTFA